ncbi:MAG: hypothetical protein ABIQ95_05585 [Bdellovibrionia bacterium]
MKGPQAPQDPAKIIDGSHNPKVTGSNPVPATNLILNKNPDLVAILNPGFCVLEWLYVQIVATEMRKPNLRAGVRKLRPHDLLAKKLGTSKPL